MPQDSAQQRRVVAAVAHEFSFERARLKQWACHAWRVIQFAEAGQHPGDGAQLDLLLALVGQLETVALSPKDSVRLIYLRKILISLSKFQKSVILLHSQGL